MSKVFRRPMFRKGGNVGDGIMTGIVDRENYNVGSYPTDLGFDNNFGEGTRSAEELGYDFNFAVPTFKRGPNKSFEDIQEQYRTSLLEAAGDRGGYDPLTTFLLQYGPQLANKEGGNLVQNLIGAAEKPVSTMLKEKSAEDRFKRDIRLKATGAAIETKKEQDAQAMDIENKLEALKADVINKGKELQNKIYANKELTDAERENLITKLGAERKLAIEKIDNQYANQLKLEKFKLDNEGDELFKAAKAEIFADEVKNYPNAPLEVAQRATEFKTVTSGELYKKIGTRSGGVLTFDINDEKARTANKRQLKELRGQVVYDPFSNRYHKITKEGFETYGSTIDSIPAEDDISTDDDSNKKKKEGPLQDFKPENEFSAFPGTIESLKQKKERFKDQAESFSNLPTTNIGEI